MPVTLSTRCWEDGKNVRRQTRLGKQTRSDASLLVAKLLNRSMMIAGQMRIVDDWVQFNAAWDYLFSNAAVSSTRNSTHIDDQNSMPAEPEALLAFRTLAQERQVYTKSSVSSLSFSYRNRA